MISKRLALALQALELKVTTIARRAGLNYNTTYQLVKGQGKVMRTDILEAVMQAFPEISADYIVRGVGSPLEERPGNESSREQPPT